METDKNTTLETDSIIAETDAPPRAQIAAASVSGDAQDITREDFLRNILFIVRETFEGSPDGAASAYLDRGVGVFPTLENLSARQVSAEINGISIAAHTEHFKFYLDRLCEFIKGRTESVNWEQSWLIDAVDDAEWNALRDAVRKSYANVLLTFAETAAWNEDNIGEAVAITAHTAYHLGAIRQIMKAV